ncbi:MAG: hypothetical protein OXR73_03445 [Myxococcales bacterium]|nr:hypothetical protein [Myxococcales bacterium]
MFTIGALVTLVWMMFRVLSEPRPRGTAGPEAEELARSLEAWSYPEGWQTTGAVKWTFAGRHQLLWDRYRQLISVRFDGVHVLRHLHTATGGRVFRRGREILGPERGALLDKAYAIWANDSFWLNPLEKLFDDGVVRQRVALPEGGYGLLVTYRSGGVTPGDAYLWLTDERGAPRAFKMWVSVIPIGGLEASWEGWKTLATGARVSTVHRVGFKAVELTQIAAARSLLDLTGGEDPFAVLF